MQELDPHQVQDAHDEAFDFIVAAATSSNEATRVSADVRQLLHVLEVVSDQRDPSKQFPLAPDEVYQRMGPRKKRVVFNKQREAGSDQWIARRNGPEEFRPHHLDPDAFWSAVQEAVEAGVLEHEQRRPMTEHGNAIPGSKVLNWWRLPVENIVAPPQPARVREDCRAVALEHRLSPVAFAAYTALRVEAGEADELLGCSAGEMKRITRLDARTARKHLEALQGNGDDRCCGVDRVTEVSLPRGRKDLDIQFCRPEEGLPEEAIAPDEIKLHHSWPGQPGPPASEADAYDPSWDEPFV